MTSRIQKTSILHNLEDTNQFAIQLASQLMEGDIVCLHGDLGVGKTTLARAIIQSLIGAEEEVLSPTFTLVQTYDTKTFPVWHLDLYRLEHPDEANELGLDEAFETSVTIIEWPEIIEDMIPDDAIHLHLSFGNEENSRNVEVN